MATPAEEMPSDPALVVIARPGEGSFDDWLAELERGEPSAVDADAAGAPGDPRARRALTRLVLDSSAGVELVLRTPIGRQLEDRLPRARRSGFPSTISSKLLLCFGAAS